MYTLEQTTAIREEIFKYGLTMPAGFLGVPSEQLRKIFNGIGCEHPEHIPARLRRALNRVMSFAQCSAAIHDFCYYNSDGTESGRAYADKMFRANLLDEIDARGGGFKWLKQWLALRAYAAVRKYGRADWCIAYAEKTTTQKP